jgi:hypothetical protein
MKITPQKCLIGLVVIALLLVFWPARSEWERGQSAAVTMMKAVPDTIVLRIHAKLQIAHEVADGRRSLVEAAALFRELNRLPPEAPELTLGDWEQSVLRAPVSSDEDRLWRQVVECVDLVLRKEVSSECAEEVMARLEAEFRAAPRRHGVIRLPDASTLTPVRELMDAARARRAAYERPPANHGRDTGRGGRPVVGPKNPQAGQKKQLCERSIGRRGASGPLPSLARARYSLRRGTPAASPRWVSFLLRPAGENTT